MNEEKNNNGNKNAEAVEFFIFERSIPQPTFFFLLNPTEREVPFSLLVCGAIGREGVEEKAVFWFGLFVDMERERERLFFCNDYFFVKEKNSFSFSLFRFQSPRACSAGN